MKLKKIGVLSLGYVTAILGFVMGVLNVIFTFLLVKNPSIGISVLGQEQITTLSSTNWWLLTGPLSAIIFGFLSGIFLALIYNLIVVKITGGLELHLDSK